MLDLLGLKVEGAFAGSVNLLECESQIHNVAATYERLRATLRGEIDSGEAEVIRDRTPGKSDKARSI
jgi:hypothetical protein